MGFFTRHANFIEFLTLIIRSGRSVPSLPGCSPDRLRLPEAKPVILRSCAKDGAPLSAVKLVEGSERIDHPASFNSPQKTPRMIFGPSNCTDPLVADPAKM